MSAISTAFNKSSLPVPLSSDVDVMSTTLAAKQLCTYARALRGRNVLASALFFIKSHVVTTCVFVLVVLARTSDSPASLFVILPQATRFEQFTCYCLTSATITHLLARRYESGSKSNR